MTETPLEKLHARLERVKKQGHYYTARCPSHDDRRNSLSFEEADDGRALVKCHAGCTTEQIVAELGLELKDLFPAPAGKPRIVATYPYTDENGELLYEVVRFEPKDFRQRRPDGKGGWVWNLRGVRRVLYRLPELRLAIRAGVAPIYFVEGEKDADALHAEGEVATCNAMGAGKWDKAYAKCLEGAGWVVIIADDDGPGREHARRVKAELAKAGIEAQLALPAEGCKDVSDHLRAGHGLGELRPLEDEPEHDTGGSESAQEAQTDDEGLTPTRPVRITTAEIMAADEPEVAELVESLVEASAPGFLAGLPEVGKGWLMLELAWRVASGTGKFLDTYAIRRTGPVLYWWEDTSTVQARKRVRRFNEANGVNPEIRVDYHLVERLAFDAVLEALKREITEHEYALVILDSLYNFAEGGYKLSDEDAASLILRAKDVCDETGAAIAFVDHMPWPTEASKGGRTRAYGSVFKNAASRWGLYLEAGKTDGEAWFSARGNNVEGAPKQLAIFDRETFRWKLVDVSSESEADKRAAMLDVIGGKPGITTTPLFEEIGGRHEVLRGVRAELESEGLIRTIEKGRRIYHYLDSDFPTVGMDEALHGNRPVPRTQADAWDG